MLIYNFFCAVKITRIIVGRDRLWVLGKFKWRSLHSSYKCIHPRQRWQRATVSSLVWPHRWFSHLFCSLESPAYYVSCLKKNSSLTSIAFIYKINNIYIFWKVIDLVKFLPYFQLLRRWHPNQRIQEPRIQRRSLPQKPAYEDILESLECRRLGHERWPYQDWLVTSSFHCLLQEIQRQCLHLVFRFIFLYLE